MKRSRGRLPKTPKLPPSKYCKNEKWVCDWYLNRHSYEEAGLGVWDYATCYMYCIKHDKEYKKCEYDKRYYQLNKELVNA